MDISPRRAEWPLRLRQLSRRNRGRRSALRVGGGRPAGRVAVAVLRGIAYDPQADEVQVMLEGPRGMHLVHRVAHPVRLDFHFDLPARRDALRVWSARGETVLVFEAPWS